jgi:DNA-binding transcriptional LysR family regulator
MPMQLTVAFDGFLPAARWGPLFHVLCLEQPRMVLRWKPVGFPTRGRSLLGDADVGLFVEPPAEAGLDTLAIESSPMVVVMAVGHPLARPHEVSVADVLDQPFPNWPELDARWRAFWSLDEHRGGPPAFAGDVRTTGAATDLVAAGAAIRDPARVGGERSAASGRRLGRPARRPRRHDSPRVADGRQGPDRARPGGSGGGMERAPG